MKKFFKTLMPLFGASFSFVNPSVLKYNEKVSIPKELFVHTKAEKKVDLETTLENNQSQSFKKEKMALNKTKVFLIVNAQKGNKKQSEKNTLLLIEAKDQTNTYLKKVRARDYLYQKVYHTWTKNKKKYVKHTPRMDYAPEEITEELKKDIIGGIERMMYLYFNLVEGGIGLQSNASIASYFRGASYLTRQKSSYKSISPVFFEENSAKNFLIENLQYLKDMSNKYEKTINVKEKFLREFSINLKNKKVISQELESINNLKIVSLGLGDFIEYYSTAPNQEGFKKVDFLFFPDLKTQVKIRKKKIRLKGFKAYQQQLYGYKNYSK